MASQDCFRRRYGRALVPRWGGGGQERDGSVGEVIHFVDRTL